MSTAADPMAADPVAADRAWWDVPPRDRACLVEGADAGLLAIALDPLPAGAPAAVRFRPPAAAQPGRIVGALLDELDRLARSLLPAWLPGAGRFGSGVPAVAAARSMARRTAAGSGVSGPFLADLAERAAGGRGGARFPDEVRAAGLISAVERAYRRDRAAVLVEIPVGLSPSEEAALSGAAEWLAAHGRCAVWLTGGPLQAIDRIPTVRVPLPPSLARLRAQALAVPEDPSVPPGPNGAAAAGPARGAAPLPAALVACSPVAGAPRWDSEAEQALERSLAPCAWAAGRRWNTTVELDVLGRPYRLDLHWPVERVAVEVDGDEHRSRERWYDDRARDVALAAEGYYVLRFPNDAVLGDVQLVAHRIRTVLNRRRDGARTPGDDT